MIKYIGVFTKKLRPRKRVMLMGGASGFDSDGRGAISNMWGLGAMREV